jgi:hypothetical protein
VRRKLPPQVVALVELVLRVGHLDGLRVAFWAVGRGWLQKQIPGGDDRKKSKGKGGYRSRSPEGMTERKAKAEAKAQQQQQQIPVEDDRKKGRATASGCYLEVGSWRVG